MPKQSVMTPGVIRSVVSSVRAGLPIHSAFELAGIGPSTRSTWKRRAKEEERDGVEGKHLKLWRAIYAARAMVERELVARLGHHGAKDDAVGARVTMWHLERQHGWTQKQQLEVDSLAQVEVSQGQPGSYVVPDAKSFGDRVEAFFERRRIPSAKELSAQVQDLIETSQDQPPEPKRTEVMAAGWLAQRLTHDQREAMRQRLLNDRDEIDLDDETIEMIDRILASFGEADSMDCQDELRAFLQRLEAGETGHREPEVGPPPEPAPEPEPEPESIDLLEPEADGSSDTELSPEPVEVVAQEEPADTGVDTDTDAELSEEEQLFADLDQLFIDVTKLVDLKPPPR